jgi:phosphoglycolate phosphatase
MHLLLFDVDGTLMDSQQMICAAMGAAYSHHGLAVPPRAQLLSIVGLSLGDAFTRLAQGADHPVAGLTAQYKEAFFALRDAGTHDAPLYPGAREAVEQLARRDDVVLGIATGKSRRGVTAMLEQYSMVDAFATIQTSDDAPSKPHPAMVLQAMSETGIDAAHTAMLGDTVFDIEMARAAGASALGVSWGYHPVSDLHAAGAVAVIDNFGALATALEKLWPQLRSNEATSAAAS